MAAGLSQEAFDRLMAEGMDAAQRAEQRQFAAQVALPAAQARRLTGDITAAMNVPTFAAGGVVERAVNGLTRNKPYWPAVIVDNDLHMGRHYPPAPATDGYQQVGRVVVTQRAAEEHRRQERERLNLAQAELMRQEQAQFAALYRYFVGPNEALRDHDYAACGTCGACTSRRVMKAAESRSRELLRSVLSTGQWAAFEEHELFVQPAKSGRRYLIHQFSTFNVTEVASCGDHTAGKWCLVGETRSALPLYDQLAMQALVLRADEERFRTTANSDGGVAALTDVQRAVLAMV